MTDLLKETEATPADYPTADTAIWPRLELWCHTRWTPREVVWVIEGSGNWTPPLSPVTALKAEIWKDGVWVDVTPDPSPLGGYCFDAGGPYRVTATVGAGPLPAAVSEAVARLVAYLDDDSAPAGVSGYRVNMGNTTIEEDITRSPSHMARALQNSGAADLLKPWKRLK